MSRVVLSLTLILLLFTSTAVARQAEVVSHIKLKPITKQQFFEIREIGLDLRVLPGDEIEVFAKPADFARLRSVGVDWEVMIPDMQKFFEGRNTDELDFGGFRTFTQIVNYIDSLKSAFPSIMTDKYSIGSSHLGREQWAVKS